MSILNNEPLEKVIRLHERSLPVDGELVTQKRGLFSKLTFVLRTPLEPISIPAIEDMILNGQRIRIQGAVVTYDPDHTEKLIEMRFPQKGDPRGMHGLRTWLIARIQFYGRTSSGQPDALSNIASAVQEETRITWGLLIHLSILTDAPNSIHTKVTVPCTIRAWPRPIDITHEISLRQVDPVLAASAGKLTPERLREWARIKLEAITKDTLASLTIDQVVREFSPSTSLKATEQIEDKIKAAVSKQARQQLGYEVNIYTATPELGIGALSQGFEMSVTGSYRTKDYTEDTFPLIVNFGVTIDNLSKAIERKWLDPAVPARDVVKYAEDDIARYVRGAVQAELNPITTYQLCVSEIEDTISENSVDSRIRNRVTKMMETLFSSSIRDFVIQRPMGNKLFNFRRDITNLCQGAIEFVYQPNSVNQINFKATYITNLNTSEVCFMNFFLVCFTQIQKVSDVKERIETRLKSYAHQFLQSGIMQAPGAVDALVGSESGRLISFIFEEAIPAIRNELGLEIQIGPLERTLPYEHTRRAELIKKLGDSQNKIQWDAAERTVQHLEDEKIISPEIIGTHLGDIEEQIKNLKNDNLSLFKSLAENTPSPKDLLLPNSANPKLPETKTDSDANSE